MKDHRGPVYRLGIVQHGEVVHRAALLYRIVGKGHVLRRQGLPVGENRVVPDGHRPGEAVLADVIPGGQVIADGQVRVGDGEGGLNERLMDVLPRSPAEGRVKARGRFRIGVHGHDDLMRLPAVPGRGCGRGPSPAPGQNSGGEGRSQQARKYSPHSRPSAWSFP